MAFAHDVLPRTRRAFSTARKAKPARKAEARQSDRDLVIECDFSEIGRDPRFPPGWYIVPGALLGVFLLLGLLLL